MWQFMHGKGGPSAAESDCICRHHNSGKSSRLQNLAEELKYGKLAPWKEVMHELRDLAGEQERARLEKLYVSSI